MFSPTIWIVLYLFFAFQIIFPPLLLICQFGLNFPLLVENETMFLMVAGVLNAFALSMFYIQSVRENWKLKDHLDELTISNKKLFF